MRFSLRTLLLMFPALMVSYALAYGCVIQTEKMQRRTSCGSICDDTRNSLRLMQFDAYFAIPVAHHPNNVTDLNDYLSGKATLPRGTRQRLLWNDYLRGDSWGNPYHCVLRETWDFEGRATLNFYSCGQDGVSHSDGNDEDDINSWSDHSFEFYAAEYRRREAQRLTVEALFCFPWTLGAVVAGWLFLRRLFCRPSGACEL